MTSVIAVAGKGGVGKTTLSSLVTLYLVERGFRPILAVDADANSNLHSVLGVELNDTVGGVREKMTEKVKAQELPAGMSKQEILEMQIEQSLVETPDFDLISMGRPEGPGCYCAINNMLRVLIDGMSGNYRYVVIDNEAGMEHLSRRTTRAVDVMFIVSDPSQRGLETAARIHALAGEMKINVGRYRLVLSRMREELAGDLADAVKRTGLEIAGVIPDDPEVARLDGSGQPMTGLGPDSAARQAVEKIMDNIMGSDA